MPGTDVLLELVLATGDPQGIGPEVSIMAARQLLACGIRARMVLVGDEATLNQAGARDLPHLDSRSGAGLYLLPAPAPRPLHDPPPSAAGGAAALAALRLALQRVRAAPGRALVTAPLSKEAVAHGEPGFCGHTGWLARELDVAHCVMVFCAQNLRVALATTHVPLGQVPSALSEAGLVATLRLLDAWLRRHQALDSPRIHVLGLNPHAGEGGLLGCEEAQLIAPAIASFNAQGGCALGPASADGLFGSGTYRDADLILAMYHDQGLLPVKLLAFGKAVNVTVGLPIVRTSVDHGCAWDLAGSRRADSGSMQAALHLALDLLPGLER